MKKRRLLLCLSLTLGLFSFSRGLLAAGAPGADDHTVALWLFDEPTYPNVILTDAGRYTYDLRLQSAYAAWWLRTEGKGEAPAEPLHVAGKYGLVPGKFGRALHLPDPSIGRVIWPDNRQRYGSVSVHGGFLHVPERFNLGYLDWTVEFWFRAEGAQPDAATIYEVRNETDYPRGVPMANALRLAPGRESFLLVSRTTEATIFEPGAAPTEYDFSLPIPTDPGRLNDGAWHHLAFTYTAAERQLRHFVDGRLQLLPGKGGFLPMIGTLTSLTISSGLHGLLDEYRVSDVVRYRDGFTPPASFSRAHQAGPPAANKPDGPPLLFPADRDPAAIIALGSRKHVLIDGALVDTLSGLAFRPQPPATREATHFRNTETWEPGPRMGSTIPDISTVWDDGDGLRILYTNNGMWGGKASSINLATSRDGIDWEKPDLGLHSWEGERHTNIVLPYIGQGSVLLDTNPAARDDERYKMILWSYYRGYYLYTSPDGIRYRRNETVGLPFDTDGSATFFWDDQRGIYQVYLRAISQDREVGRRIGHVEIDDLFAPWPFQPAARPWIDDLVLARPALGELPVIDTGGQVYRFKARKYDWAPDVYVAFPWRYILDGNIRPGSFLMVSRDGANWTRYEDPYYFPGGWELDGRTVLEALMEDGLIRRGNELWQFGTVRFTEHGGALYRGVEHEGGTHDRLLRLTQRLDGFVAVTPTGTTGTPGTLVTKPLTFTGAKLELNVNASGGSARIELQDASGKPIPGFTLADSVPVREDNTAARASWKSGADLASLAGRTVRLKVELTGAKLYAFQFR